MSSTYVVYIEEITGRRPTVVSDYTVNPCIYAATRFVTDLKTEIPHTTLGVTQTLAVSTISDR